MSELYPKIKLTPTQTQRLRKLSDQEQAIRSFIQNVVRQGEERIAAVSAEGRDLWRELAKEYNLDLDRVTYGPDMAFENLVPISAKLA